MTTAAERQAAIKPESAPPSLATKLSLIMGELGNVEKKGHNKAQNYDFVREADIVAAVVPLLSKYHVLLHTTITSHTRDPLYQTQSGLTMWMTTVYVDGTWIDGDTGEKLDIATFVGTGADTGDKGVYKAMTGAEKYMLMKSFLISTGDDPEGDEKVDKATAATEATAGPVRVSRGTQKGVERGGKSNLATTAQVTEIARHAKRLSLDADAIIPIIKKVVGTEPSEGQSLREWLGGMTGEQAAAIIAALAEFVANDGPVDEPVETVDIPEPDDEDGGEPTLAVV